MGWGRGEGEFDMLRVPTFQHAPAEVVVRGNVGEEIRRDDLRSVSDVDFDLSLATRFNAMYDGVGGRVSVPFNYVRRYHPVSLGI